MQITGFNPYTPSQNNRYSFKAYNAGSLKKIASGVKRAGDRSTSYIGLGLGKVASWKPAQNLVDWLKNKNYQEHLAAFVGCTLSGFYMLDTARSKTIEKDQKMPLITNQAIVCGLSTAGAYTLNHYLNRKINHLAELFHISKIEDKNLQTKFLKYKTNPEYINVVRRTAEIKPGLKAIMESLDKMFDYSEKVPVYLKEEIKKHKDDSVARNFLKEIKNIVVEKGKDKGEIVKALYLEKMKNSKAMQAAYNRELMNNAIKKLANADKSGKLSGMMNGFKTAQALMVFALIYRFISPVFATPLANYISAKVESRKNTQKQPSA